MIDTAIRTDDETLGPELGRCASYLVETSSVAI